jgi:hypothetical protein
MVSFSPLLKGLSIEIDDDIAADENEKEALQDIISNIKLSEGYLTLARDIEVMEPKSPEDIYKVNFVSPKCYLLIACIYLFVCL